jgi:hypothetical protein
VSEIARSGSEAASRADGAIRPVVSRRGQVLEENETETVLRDGTIRREITEGKRHDVRVTRTLRFDPGTQPSRGARSVAIKPPGHTFALTSTLGAGVNSSTVS